MDPAAPATLPLDYRQYAPFLMVPCRDGRVVPVAVDAPCEWCCHWSLPLTRTPNESCGFPVPLRFEEWLVYHWHVVNHQRGAPLS